MKLYGVNPLFKKETSNLNCTSNCSLYLIIGVQFRFVISLQTINPCNIYYLILLPSLHTKNDHKAVRNDLFPFYSFYNDI
jgi:hypothetical protein